MRHALRVIASWFGAVRPDPDGDVFHVVAADGPQAQGVYHIHKWGSCKWNGQYWYARCIADESCTARIAC